MNRGMRVWAVVPMKALDQSKSRLSSVLTTEERVALSFEMLVRVVAALSSAQSLAGWIAVSSDESVLNYAAERGGRPLMEREKDLNAALCQAAQEAVALGGEAIVIVPGDVPFVSAYDIDAIVSLASEERTVAIAPSRRCDGTNALLLKPPDLIPFSFGPGSLQTHVALARETGAALHTYSSDGIAFDVDTEEDWHELTTRSSK